MSELDQALEAFRAHEGVEHVLVAGRDGLLIQHAGNGSLDAETVSAMVPGVVSAATALGQSAGCGEAATVAVKLAEGVAIVGALADDLLLAVLVRDGVGFAPLLRDVADRRASLAALV